MARECSLGTGTACLLLMQPVDVASARKRTAWPAAACALGLGLLCAACIGVESTVEPPPVDDAVDPSAASGAPDGLTEDVLANLEYEIDGAAVPLSDGRYQVKPSATAASFEANVSLGSWRAYGDLNGDGTEDAAVVLVDAPGGSGVFTFLAAVLGGGDGPRAEAATALGDRTQIDGVQVEDGVIVVAGKTHGPDDPMCCPSQAFQWRYRLVDGALVREE